MGHVVFGRLSVGGESADNDVLQEVVDACALVQVVGVHAESRIVVHVVLRYQKFRGEVQAACTFDDEAFKKLGGFFFTSLFESLILFAVFDIVLKEPVQNLVQSSEGNQVHAGMHCQMEKVDALERFVESLRLVVSELLADGGDFLELGFPCLVGGLFAFAFCELGESIDVADDGVAAGGYAIVEVFL